MKPCRRSPSYIIRNPYSYCFRMIVPRDLRKFVGRIELRYTLSTGQIGLAKSRARLLAGQVQEFFRRLRGIVKLGDLTDEQIVEIVNRYFRNFAEGLERIRVEPDAINRGDVFDAVNQINQSVCNRAKKALAENDYSYVWPQVTDVLVREDLEVEKLSVSHNKICREMLKGMISFGEIQNRRQQGDYSDDLKEVFPLSLSTAS